MPRSTGTAPKGGYNFVLADYKGPQTAGAEVITSDNPAGGTSWWSEDHTNHKIKVDTIGEYTAAAGVTIDGVQLKDNFLVKNYTDFSGSVTFSASGSMTVVGTPSVQYVRYTHITSNLTLFEWRIDAFELGGTASSAFRISLPVTPAVESWTQCYLYPPTSGTDRQGVCTASIGGYLAIARPDFSNFTLGAAQETRGQILYLR